MKKLLILISMLSPFLGTAQQKPKKSLFPKSYDIVVGAYTSGKSSGLSVYRFYTESGRIAYLNRIDDVSNPSYVAVSANNKFVYAVNENDNGEVSSFKFDGKTGALTFINKVSTLGGSPCYVSVDKEQKNLFVANYSGGNIAVLPINVDGSIGAAVQTIKDEGHGVNKERQEKAHVHTAVLSPDEKYVLYTDLGTDKINITKYKGGKENPIVPVKPAFVSVTPGYGPRHLAFSNDKKYLYAIMEMGSAVLVYDYNNGKPKLKQDITLLADGFKGATGAADIHITPNGKFLYATNRGDANDISVFSINQENGELTFIERKPTGGKGPRNFAIDPSGRFIVIAHQTSDSIIVYKIDENTGKIGQAVSRVEVGNPVCVKFASAM
ncbi:lactonase family protein [Mucilaginibacter sp. RB4R14]|uniref:lactonase family protein n=1 Tax=Mucilaginibacter aurantiaciroseus TaxID=2949308 RepID=UPI002090D4C4|nr:lactonase family protein [Mucilaginibacter aurantiaciroseus]MCO5937179.1 lactonase family protein [Mucilaginibacter aurantiaciroseus]